MDRPQSQNPKHENGNAAPLATSAHFLKTDFSSEKLIARGEQGEVFEARLPRFGTCAVKYIYALYGGKFVPEAVRFAHRELAAIQTLSHHPNIVIFYGTVRDDQQNDIGFVTEFMEGGSLMDVINKTLRNEITISDAQWEKMATRWAIQIGRALDYCHWKNVMHRDVKPENTLLSEDLKTIKLCDFGLSRSFSDLANSCKRGTRCFMAPEVFMEGQITQYDFSADVFSYAMFLYTLFHRWYPYIDGVDERDTYQYFAALKAGYRPMINPTLPVEIRSIIEKCWETNSRERMTMHQVTEILEEFWDRRYPGKDRRSKSLK